MDLYLEIAGNQIDGARDYQEDAFSIAHLDDESGEGRTSALVVMADGMGGHAAGNIASNLVVNTFNRTFTGKFGKEEVPGILREALERANDALKASIKETPALDGMGCTMVTAAFTKGKVYWVSVGDSHLYLIRDKALEKRNEDHSYGGYLDRMKAQGVDVEPEAGLSRNMLMSAMTGDEIAEIDCPNKGLSLQAGDRVIVASDGLDTLSEGTVIQTAAWSESAKDCVEGLLKAVDEAKKPRQDNTTVIVVDVLAREAPPEPAPPPPREGGDTQPLREADIHAAMEEEESGGKKGLLIGAAVLVLAALGGGGWFFLGGGDEAPTTVASAPAASAPEASAPAAEAGAAEEPEPAPAPAQAEPEPASEVETAASAGAGAESGAAPTPAPEAPEAREFADALASGGEGPTMVRVPAGTFQMGTGGLSTERDEQPQHEVTVEPFAMSKHEITFEEYERFANSTGRAIPDNLYLDKETHPVIFVSWDDAFAYTQWLSEQTGERYRLPTEAEWEYAARAGTTTPYYWGYDIGENNAHCFDCKTGLNPRQPTRVGRFDPNAFGLHDMAGNVQEWVHDCYHASYRGAPADGGVWEGGQCQYRVARGGAYSNPGKSLRAAKREKWTSTQGYDSVGIRVVREVE